jgi:hypothetical protein
VDFGKGCDACTLRIMAAAPDNEVSKGGQMEVRLDNPTGDLLGTLDFTPTGEWANYREFAVELDEVDALYDEQTICLVFLPDAEYLLNYTKLMLDVETDEPVVQPPKDEPPAEEPPADEKDPSSDEHPPEEEQPQGTDTAPSPLPWLIGGGAALLAAVGAAVAFLVGKKRKRK